MTRRALALLLLREAGPRGVTTGEFLEAGVGSRYGARLLELRKEGHQIEAQRLREGSWRYVLSEAGVSAGSSVESLAASVESGGALEPGIEGVRPRESAVQLFPDDDAWLALREKDVA